jgi:hypothetical protein
MSLKKISLLFLACFGLSPLATADVFKDLQGIDAETYESYASYWKQYHAAIETKYKEKRNSAYSEIRKLEQAQDSAQAANQQGQIEQIKKARQKYQAQLERTLNGQDAPNILLNLGKMSLLEAELLTSLNRGDPSRSLESAEESLRQIQRDFPGYANYTEALWNLGQVYERLSRKSDALNTYLQLAAENRTSLHVMQGQMQVGDLYFEQEKSSEALSYYRKALATHQTLAIPNSELAGLKIQYRIAWAAYRSGDLSQLLRTTEELLAVGRFAGPQMLAIREDAIDLLADALVERGTGALTIEWLQRPRIMTQAGAVADRVMAKYLNAGRNGEVVAVGNWVKSRFALHEQYPDILLKLAAAERATGRSQEFLKNLEFLAILLQPNSLWRSKNSHRPDLIAAMEKNATLANKIVGAFYYEKGFETGMAHQYKLAASYYQNLVDFLGSSKESIKWRFRVAHSRFFAGELAYAANLYMELTKLYPLEQEQLELAMYQRVVINEMLWRQEFGQLQAEMSDEKNSRQQERLQFLRNSMDDYAAKFPKSSRSYDLLIAVAGAYQDSGDYKTAQALWKRVISEQSSTHHASAAVRGLIFSALQLGDRKELISILIDLLRVQDKIALNRAVINEVLGVLSVSLSEHGAHMSTNGRVDEAGRLLVQVAKDYPDLPDRDKLWRDGALLLGMAGSWPEALDRSDEYLNVFNNSPWRGDIAFLRARAYQYLLRFDDAVDAYIEFGQNYPKHEKFKEGVQKGLELAQALDSGKKTGILHRLLANVGDDAEEKRAQLKQSIAGYMEVGDLQGALASVEELKRQSRTRESQMDARLQENEIKLSTQDRDAALRAIRAIEKEAAGMSGRAEIYSQIAGQAALLIAMKEMESVNQDGEQQAESALAAFNRAEPMFQKAIRSGNNEAAVKARLYFAQTSTQVANGLAALINTQTGMDDARTARYLRAAESLRENARKNLQTLVSLKIREQPTRTQSEAIAKAKGLLEQLNPAAKDVRGLSSQDHLDLPREWSY